MGNINFKNVQYQEPEESLKPYVKFYVSITFEAPDFPLWIPADRRNQLLILKKGKVELSSKSSTYFQPEISIRASFDIPLEVKFAKGAVEVIAIDFSPVGLFHLFGIDMKTHLNQIEEFNSAEYGIDFDTINDSNFKSKLDQILKKRLEHSESKYASEIAKGIFFAKKKGGKCERAEVAQHIALNPKTFYRHFKKFTGFSPKKYFNIIQFEATLIEMIKNEEVDKMELLDQSGYYDQSHFIKAIQKFSGSSPEKIKNLDSNWMQFLLENDLYH